MKGDNLANIFVGAYMGGDVGNIDIPFPMVVVDNVVSIQTNINVRFEPGSNATQINTAIVDAAIARANSLGFIVSSNNVLYTPFSRG